MLANRAFCSDGNVLGGFQQPVYRRRPGKQAGVGMKTGIDIEEGRYAWSLCSYVVKSVPINERIPNRYLWVSLSSLPIPCAASNDTINTLSLQAVLSPCPFSLFHFLCCEGLYPHFATSLLILERVHLRYSLPSSQALVPVFPSCGYNLPSYC